MVGLRRTRGTALAQLPRSGRASEPSTSASNSAGSRGVPLIAYVRSSTLRPSVLIAERIEDIPIRSHSARDAAFADSVTAITTSNPLLSSEGNRAPPSGGRHLGRSGRCLRPSRCARCRAGGSRRPARRCRELSARAARRSRRGVGAQQVVAWQALMPEELAFQHCLSAQGGGS